MKIPDTNNLSDRRFPRQRTNTLQEEPSPRQRRNAAERRRPTHTGVEHPTDTIDSVVERRRTFVKSNLKSGANADNRLEAVIFIWQASPATGESTGRCENTPAGGNHCQTDSQGR